MEDNAELLESLTSADVVTFVKGDKVKVTGGDLVGLYGYVHAVRDDNVVEVMPQLTELTEVLALPPSQLVKTFEVPPLPPHTHKHTPHTPQVLAPPPLQLVKTFEDPSPHPTLLPLPPNPLLDAIFCSLVRVQPYSSRCCLHLESQRTSWA